MGSGWRHLAIAGGLRLAAPGVSAPDWASDAGASAPRGTWPPTRFDSIDAFPGLIGATRPAA
jgi:hypothetical protein